VEEGLELGFACVPELGRVEGLVLGFELDGLLLAVMVVTSWAAAETPEKNKQ
jgi:hypothetical protein